MIAGLRDYAEFIPLKEELFDLIIIDEASQVSIAQALPAMLRCKKMLQMTERSILLWTPSHLSSIYIPRWVFRREN